MPKVSSKTETEKFAAWHKTVLKLRAFLSADETGEWSEFSFMLRRLSRALEDRAEGDEKEST